MSADLHIFISYAHIGGREMAARLLEDLQNARFRAWLDTTRLAGGACWTAEIEHAIDGSQVVLALLSNGSYNSDVCRAEQLRALRKGKHVIPLLVQPASEIPLYLEGKQYRDFTGSAPYDRQLEALIADMREGKGGVPLKEGYRHTYVTAPPLPRNYVERSRALVSLRSALITDGSGASIALTALKGMGGIGKTVLAQALCHDEVIQQAFPDGIAWVTAGRESTYDLMTRMREVRRALNDSLAAPETELECINRYRNLLREKAALVVVDDVWASHDIEPFRAESPRSRILFTTRDASIAAAVGAEEHLADLLTEDQSRDMLARWAGVNVDALPQEAGDLVRECGRLPLALSMIGAMLRGKPREYWKHVLNLLRGAELAKIATDFPNYIHKDLLRAMQVSVDGLDSIGRDRYFTLAIALEDMPIHSSLQQVLWDTDELDALDTAERFISLSLAQRDGQDRGIRLHDLQLDYLRAHYSDKECLHLIQGAVRLSSQTIEKDPRQFTSQLIGRLLPHLERPGIQRFTGALRSAVRGPWLRLVNVTLHPPGTGLLRTLEGHSASVNHVAITPDGVRAVSGSWDNTLKVWDLESGREIHTLSGHSASVPCVAVTPDGRYAVSASEDDTLKVWDLEAGGEVRTLIGHGGSVNGVTITPDGRRILSASWDRTLRLWDLDSGRELRTLKGHIAPVTSVALTADGRRAVSASADYTLKIWDLESGRELRTLKGHSASVTSVAISPDGRRAASASWDKTLRVWDPQSGPEVHTLAGHSRFVSSVAVSPDGCRGVSACWDATIKAWDLESGRELKTLSGHQASVDGVAVSPDGRLAVSASLDTTLKVWDVESGRELRTLAGHSKAVSAVAVTPDGRFAVSASRDNTLKVWDLEFGRELRTLAGHEDGVTAVAISPDGHWVVSASVDETLKQWDLESGRELRTLRGHGETISGVAISPDGRLAVSASWDHMLKVWDLESGSNVRTLTGHSDRVSGVALNAGGHNVVSTSVDKSLVVWDLHSGIRIAAFTCDSPAYCCAAAGARILVGDQAGRVHLLVLEHGR